MRMLSFNNRQRTRAVDIPLLRRITRHVLETELGVEHYELGIHLVDADEMASVNQEFLGHEGSTDVITFDHHEPAPSAANPPATLHGEIFISLPDAVKQAREFKTTWQSELVRYVIHGILHLRGHDDLHRGARRAMKREENRLLQRVAEVFPVRTLARGSHLSPPTSPLS
jgi:probable rRNA maturation factor